MRMFRLDGKIALVTGASGRLGAAMAAALAEAGANLILHGRDADRLAQTAARLSSLLLAGTEPPRQWLFDLADDVMLERHLSDLPRLDVLVNNAYWGPPGSVDTATAAQFQDALNLGLAVPFRCIQLSRDAMRRAGTASVINIASMYGMVSPDFRVYEDPATGNPPYYGAAKGGLLQLTRYLACQLAQDGIRVNAISPGPFPPPAAPARLQESLCAKVPLGRLGRPDDLGGAVVYLASEASAYVTGQNLAVDGGWTAW